VGEYLMGDGKEYRIIDVEGLAKKGQEQAEDDERENDAMAPLPGGGRAEIGREEDLQRE